MDVQKEAEQLARYMKHLPSCNTRVDWFEAIDAANFLPEPERSQQLDEISILRKKCTCGLGSEATDLILQYTEKICRKQRENCKKVFTDIFFDDAIANDILNAPSPVDNSHAICGDEKQNLTDKQ